MTTEQQKLAYLDLCLANLRPGEQMRLLWSEGSHLDDQGRPTDREWREDEQVRTLIERHLRARGATIEVDKRGITLFA